MTVDVVAIGAHPDDVEMIVGGTLAKLIDRGRKVAIIDMTRGEMGTRGTPELRKEEADAAAMVLGVHERINLDLGDGNLENNQYNRTRLIEELRRLRPSIVMTHYWDDLHPDHAATGEMIKDIMYPIGFKKYPAKGEPFRPNEFLYFMAHFPFEPSFIVDITGYLDRKIEAVKCYASQLHSDSENEPPTNISQPDFLDYLRTRAHYFGKQIQKSHGEPFLSRRPIPVEDPVEQYRPFPRF